MTCTACGHENRLGAKFCEECAAPLKRLCASCGSELRPTAKFCDGCGASVAARPVEAAGARKVVTIIFADLAASTALHERLDPESVTGFMESYYRAMRGAVEAHGGTVVKLLGDGVMAAFGMPRVAEDDAIRAVRAAVGMQHAFRELAHERSAAIGDIGLRVAVNTGEVVVSAANDDVVGDPVNVAARLQQEGRDGDVVIGESTRRLVSELVTLVPLGAVALKGRSETVTAYRVVSLERPAGATATAFVGRDDELRRVMAVYDAAVAAPAARLAVILGSPGLGKSRLLEELGRRLGGTATVLTAHCDAEGGATFAPLAEALRELLRQAAHEPASSAPAQGVALGSGLAALSGLSAAHSVEDQQPQRGGQPIARGSALGSAPGGGGAAEDLRAALDAAVPGADAERARIVDGIMALLGGSPASPEETFFVIRRFLTALTTTQPASPAASQVLRPVLLAIDDLQWAEPLLLDLVEHLVQWGSGVPLLVLAAARPELRDSRSSLASAGGLVADVVTLGGLDAAAATRLAANVIGAEALPAAVAGRVLATSEGNPLFVGELVRMLVNDGALKREGDRWTTAVDLAALTMPPTIHALLAARIERLRPEDRAVLERAAVVGRQFSRAAVAHLLPRDVTDLDARLEALRRSELIEPDTGWFLGEPALRFHHGLTRDAAYRRVLKGTRAELHGRFADWIETKVGETIEHDETLGWHLEQAHQHLRELGPIDVQGRAFGERAARYLAAAGRRALARDDLPVAANLLGRALARLDDTDPSRADLALDWCEALLSAGDVGTAGKAIAELGRFIGTPVPAPSPGNEFPGSVDQSRLKPTAKTSAESPSGDFSATQPGNSFPGVGTGAGRLRAWHTCFVGQLAVLTDPQALHATADAVAAAAEELASVGDTAGEAKAHSVHAAALQRLGKIGACEAALDKALAAARRADDRRRSNAVLAGAPLAALWGPSPVTRASGRCLDVVRVLRITQGAPAVEAVALRCQAVLEALRGRAEAARRMIASSRRMVEELGITQGLLEADMFAGLIELIEGDAVAAEQHLRGAYEGLREHGLGIDAARAAAFLGRALLLQSRATEAEALSHESEALAGDDLLATITWRGVRAEALARCGEHAAAIDFARAAVDIAAATDVLLFHADARLVLAATLRAAGRRDDGDAAAEEKRAIELWEAKGATLLAERARRTAQSPTHPSVSPLGKGRTEEGLLPTVQPARRRVGANAATAHVACMDAAMAARDAGALPTLFADELEVVDHPTGSIVDRQGTLTSLRSMLRVPDLTHRHEPLATLGDSLGLFRVSVSASAVAGKKFDVGTFDIEKIDVVEVDAQGRGRRVEDFAPDRLGDAVARLYERYADLLSHGPARVRAAATARSVATLVGPVNVDRWATAIARGVETADHRTLGIGSSRGAGAFLRGLGSLLEVANDVVNRTDDVLAVRSDAVLLRRTNFGTERAGGGAYERLFLVLWVFGADGLLARLEQFDADRDAEALARFDELVGSNPSVSPLAKGRTKEGSPARRVRPNAATAHAAREDAAFAARDGDAFATLFADEVEAVDHPNGATLDRLEYLTSLGRLLRVQDLTRRHEPLASLGDALALCRLSLSAGGIARGNFDVGAYEVERVILFEVNAQGQCTRTEVFAPDRLGDAVVRLYERYAELLPAGPARARAAVAARAVAFMLTRSVVRDHLVFAPTIEAVDHRTVGYGALQGAEAAQRALDATRELSEGPTHRIDDVLVLSADALLRRTTSFGIVRASGGTYERSVCVLSVFGADGRVTRHETFDADREAEALARFDELTGEAQEPLPQPLSEAERGAHLPPSLAGKGARGLGFNRRVRANAATAHAARVDAAIAARDADALPTIYADEFESVDHLTGTTWDRQGLLATWRFLLSARDPLSRHESLATLGDSLALCRVSTSASGFAGRTFDVGAYQREEIILNEVDAQGRRAGGEVFASDRLGDAITRLYERYAELLPDGPARARAAATARSVAAVVGPPDLDRRGAALAPAVEFVDHRSLGFPPTTGAEAYLRRLGTLFEVSDDIAERTDDILDLRSDALLVRWTSFGTDRVSGGAYERPFLNLYVFGADGLATRNELFDVDRDTEALARFDELVAEAPAAQFAGPQAAEKRQRRVRPNAATANAARFDTMIAGRNADALPTLFAAAAEFVEHPTGVVYDREGVLLSLRSLLGARDPAYRHEPLATLGDALALCRVSWSASGLVGGKFDVGAYEADGTHLVEVDARGRRQRNERFAVERLGDAITGLYERYADLLPTGQARARATATARSVAALLGPFDPERYATAFAPAIESVDHRTLGTWSARGAEAALQHHRSWLQLADEIVIREDDVLGLQSGACLLRRTFSGTDRASGGAFERQFILLWLFGTDGLLSRWEFYDANRDEEALARFDELVPRSAEGLRIEAPVRRFENAATRAAAAMGAAWEARDWKRLAALLPAGFRNIDRRKMVRVELDREHFLEGCRSFLEMASSVSTQEVLATRGDRLALLRDDWKGADRSVGPSELDLVEVLEVNAAGERIVSVFFDPDDLDAAYAELDARYAAGEAAAFARQTHRLSVLRTFPGAAPDWESFAELFAPDFVVEDHSPLGWGTFDRPTYIESVKALAALAPDTHVRTDHLWLCDHGALGVHVVLGTHEGGAFEQPRVTVSEVDAQGRERRRDIYALDQLDDALARYEELTAVARAPARIANAATLSMERFEDAWEARDWERVAAEHAPGFRLNDRRTMVRLDADRESYLRVLREGLKMVSSRSPSQVLATRGERLALARARFEGSGRSRGPTEIEWLNLIEVDDHGERVAQVMFDPDDLDAAYAELDVRYTAGEAAPYAATWELQLRHTRAIAAGDWEQLAAAYTPDCVMEDHRPLGLPTLRSRDEIVASIRAFADLRPDATARAAHVLALDDRRILTVTGWVGSEPEGMFEIPVAAVVGLDPDGHADRVHIYNLDQLDEARACFAELRHDPLRIPPNAATRARDRTTATRDWVALRALVSTGFVFEDRRKRSLVSGDVELWIRNLEMVRAIPGRVARELIGTVGDRIALERFVWTGDQGGGAFENEFLCLTEVDAGGLLTASVTFDVDDRNAAFAEAQARFVAGEAAAIGGQAPIAVLVCAFARRDWETLRGCLADDLVLRDHRTLGLLGALRPDEWVESMRVQADLAPDSDVETLWIIAWNRHGRVEVSRTFGTIRDGGPFENVFLRVMVTNGDRIQHFELFDVGDADPALARFAELCAARAT